MIDTTIHNQLIDQQTQIMLVQAEKERIRANRSLLLERLKSWSFIALFIFLILLLVIILMWLFPDRSFSTSSHASTTKTLTKQPSTEMSKKESEELLPQQQTDQKDSTKKRAPKPTPVYTNKPLPKEKKQGDKIPEGKQLKEGVEFVKKDNHVYKQVWKHGNLIQETRYEESIEDTRKKHHVKIPQMAVPQKGKEEKTNL